METQGATPSLSQRVVAELRTNAVRIKAPGAALRLWERVLTPKERQWLGGDLETLYRQHSTAGIWMKLRGVSVGRAIADVAHALNLIDSSTYEWLLRELGEDSQNPEEVIQAAIASGSLVLVERPRAAHWHGEAIEIAWGQRSALWDFFWELCRQAKAGLPIDHASFPASNDPGMVAKQKSRLTALPGFPQDLADRIQSAGRYSQRLDLAPPQIRLFELVVSETLRERKP